MSVDASKLKRRRGLGSPPTEGAPGIEETEAIIRESEAHRPPPLDHTLAVKAAAQPEVPPPLVSEPIAVAPDPTLSDAGREGEGATLAEPDPTNEEFETVNPLQGTQLAVTRSRREEVASDRRQRVPPPEVEPRVPFTTRVTQSTKERLEDACYHLRRKHQDFINEAILAHLKKNGF